MYCPVVCLLVTLCSTNLSAASLTPAAVQASAPLRQPELRGHVVDGTGSPVASAQITVRPEAGGAAATILADGRGDFALPLPAGVYRLTVSAAGFEETSTRVTVSAAQERVAVDVVLAVAGFTETVEVEAPRTVRATAIHSATKTPTPLRDVPQSVSVVTSALIADQRMSSMADVVRFMPGVSMGQGEGNRDTPILRGNSSTSDFFVDGVRDDVQYFRDVYNLERVEALKGPNAMIFGRGGAGGVINRVTRQAQWGQAKEVTLQLGSWDNRRMTADFGAALNDTVAARVTGMYENSDSYRSGVALERLGVQPSVAFRLGPATTLRASYEYFHDERTADRGIPSFKGRPLVTDAGTFFGDPAGSPTHATVNVFASVIEHDLGDQVTVRNRVSYGLYDKFYQNVFPGAVNAAGTAVSLSAYNNATDRRNLFNQTDLTVRRRAGGMSHTFLVGAELGRQVTDNFRSTGHFSPLGSVTSIEVPLTAPTVSVPVAFRQSATDADNHGVATVAALYAQDQVELTEHLQAVAGLRLDAFELDFTNNRTGATLASRDRLVSPRLGLIYKPIVPVSVYGSYSLAHLPRGGDQLSSLSLTNQSLEPETFRNYEVGVKWDASPSLGASAAVYRLDRGNVAVPDPADPTRSLLVDAQQTRGLEVELSGSPTRALTVMAGYAYQDGEITRSISSTTQAGASLAQLPAHSFSLWSRYDITPRWSGALGIVSRTDMFASTDNRVVVPGFTRVDAAVFFDLTSKLRAQLNVQNLFDVDYYAAVHSNNNITPGSPRAARFSLTTRF
ncbi:MAG TPA: TonB-dependent siderophore receptor [Vicinamibacterales bacterium]|nr:TonB-dependent siderophore receptor [Vicinamibacterales bacterium]